MSIENIRRIKEEAKIVKPKKIYYLPKVSEKKKKQLAAQRESGTDNGLDIWFEERRKKMKGKCCLCSGKTEKDNDETYRRSIHHLLDKKKVLFPSVATHPDNWLELCFYGNSCHQNIHSKTITWELLHDSKEWDMIVAKFKKIYPFINPAEHKNIHPLLLKEIEKM